MEGLQITKMELMASCVEAVVLLRLCCEVPAYSSSHHQNMPCNIYQFDPLTEMYNTFVQQIHAVACRQLVDWWQLI